MFEKIKVFSIVLVLVFFSCKKDDGVPQTIAEIIENPVPESKEVTLSKITGFAQNRSFVDAKGDSFFPWGFNYTNPQIIGLIEDNWNQESTWDIIREDFAEMKGYSANIVRIHLQFHRFMNDINTPNQVALQRLQRLVQIAEDTGLYLDVTGLAAYRKSDAPEWYDSLSDTERWEAHANFWKNIAATIGNSEAVFAYNLMNEPVVNNTCDGTNDCEWVPGPGFGGFHFIQNIAKNSEMNYATTIKAWIALLTGAIRTEDSATMITVGFLAIGSITQFEEDLGYSSIHVYPKSEELQLSVDKVLNNQGEKPLILEETSNLECTIAELEAFLNQVDGKYNGLMGHYFGTTKEELEATDGFSAALRKNFLEFFVANSPN